tara:strand:+ start:323 stop:481 length:159 start_codon:yes stop_codon:yes gene_type:complete
MKVGDFVKLYFNDLTGIIITEADDHGWFIILDTTGRQWEVHGGVLEKVNEGG